MNQNFLIQKTSDYVKETLANAEGGHDYWHIYRVWNLSKYIAKTEAVNLQVVELGALLHDIADSKFYGGDETIGPRKAGEFLYSLGVEDKTVIHVQNIIANISFKGASNIQTFKSLELDVVQDADRLDAMGAIGIARVFSFGGYKNKVIYDPNLKPNPNMTKEQYKQGNNTSLNHFYEKLLLLKGRMNTKTGKLMAEHRHDFMLQFLEEFYQEWDGKI